MNVTPDLLIRYYRGQTSADETRAVDEWLANPVADESISDAWTDGTIHPSQDEQEVRSDIWHGIQKSLEHNKQPATSERIVRFRPFGRIASAVAAACAVLWLGNTLLTGLTSSKVIDTNQQTLATTVLVDHLKLVVQPNSRCVITTSPFQNETVVRFHGAVAITSNAGNYQTGKLIVECDDSEKSDWLRLAQGKTFLAMTDDVYQLITATTDELHDEIPRPFSDRLVHRFQQY